MHLLASFKILTGIKGFLNFSFILIFSNSNTVPPVFERELKISSLVVDLVLAS